MVKYKVKPSLGPVLCLLLLLTACANFSAVDKPISQVTPLKAEQIASERSSDLLVLVGFSGGGPVRPLLLTGCSKRLPIPK